MFDVSVLRDNCIFRSHERAGSHALVATELCDHHLRWRAGRVETRLCKFDTPTLSLYALQYGAEVEIFPKPYEGFSLVHFSLRGGIEVEADGRTDHVREGRALVSSPRWNIRLRYESGCEQLIMRVPHDLLGTAAAELGQPDALPRFAGAPGTPMCEAASRQWLAQLHAFLLLGPMREAGTMAPWRRRLETNMAIFLLLQGGATRRDEAQRIGCSSSIRRASRLQGYVESNLTQPITLADLADSAALSKRQTNAFCQSHFGAAPMVWLRRLRLDAIRRELLSNPEEDIAGVAMSHGFFHLGRFSAYYRDRFGELPNVSRKSARSG